MAQILCSPGKQTQIKYTMKKILTGSMFVIAASAMLLTGCENYKEELVHMTSQKDSLVAVANAKEQSIEEFLNAFEEVENSLAEITEKQNLVKNQSADDSELSRDMKTRIQAEIAMIGQLLDESKVKTEELTKKLKQSNFKVGKFEKMIASLNEQITAKDEQMQTLAGEITILNTQVATLNQSVESLSVKDSMNNDYIAKQTTKLNTAYIAVGDYKKLRDEKVVTKEGGFLGLGKEEKLSPQLNTEAFSEVDITRINNIPLDSKDAKLVTVHPTGSYSIEKQNDRVSEIKITDADKFWSTSKYLVVMTK
jgi:predicted  nucleic acid-binding Zn-ribbon protein